MNYKCHIRYFRGKYAAFSFLLWILIEFLIFIHYTFSAFFFAVRMKMRSSSSCRPMIHWVSCSVSAPFCYSSAPPVDLSALPRWVLHRAKRVWTSRTAKTYWCIWNCSDWGASVQMWLWHGLPTVVSILFGKNGILRDLWLFTLLRSDPVSMLMG